MDKDMFDAHSAQGLTYSMFFYNCKLFGLRAGDEHRDLCREQFIVDFDSAGRYLQFMGRPSKNIKGFLRQKDITTRDLKICAQPKLGERCIVDIYNHYFGLIPPLRVRFIANWLVVIPPNSVHRLSDTTNWQAS